jgi:hypothetical protein
MELNLTKWESQLRADDGLRGRLTRLDSEGFPATKKGDLLALRVRGRVPIVVSWDGTQIQVSRREARKPFCSWTMDEGRLTQLFLGSSPPILVAMNNDQANVKMAADHHNGALVLSFMILLQECTEGGEGA